MYSDSLNPKPIIQDDLTAKGKQLQNLTDAAQDVEELELSEDSFPFQLG